MKSPNTPSNHKHRFKIDDYKVPLPVSAVSTTDLRKAVSPEIPPNVEIWRDTDGGEDVLIGDDETIVIVPGDVFYTRDADGGHRRNVPIVIAGQRVMARAVSVLGKSLRELAEPPIPADFTMYRDMDGSPDEKIDNDEIVTLCPGAEFFAVPSITPGGGR